MQGRTMPLTELMNYFNDQLQTQARTRSLPKTGFFKADNSYWGRFGNLILGSRFQAIHTFVDDALIGYNSDLLVRSATGNSLNIDSIFNSLDSTDQIIHLDRLVRTLHSLNYLQQFDGRKDLLSLQVQPRHIISVVSDHGKTFEKILSDCGLGPERVLLHTRLLDTATLPHFQQALASYRQRGYKIGIHLSETGDLDLLVNLGLTPDIIFADHPALTTLLIDNPLPGIFDPSLRILVARKPGIDVKTSSVLDGYLFNTEDTFVLPQSAIS
jgi:EAL domain-containing protein (putative c-di-GMP-specific phosphodiesterase class I)